jgi:hypothetical protein
MIPTIGRILHYVSRGSADGVYPPVHVPFIVTAVDEIEFSEDVFPTAFIALGDGNAVPFRHVVSGWTFNNRGQRYEEDVPFLGGHAAPATCHWPEREE